jgi:hypothetical protein
VNKIHIEEVDDKIKFDELNNRKHYIVDENDALNINGSSTVNNNNFNLDSSSNNDIQEMDSD